MEDKQIFGILVSLIFWPLVLYWFWKRHKESVETKRAVEEYNKPENKFKREIAKLGLSLKPFEGRGQYPYILTPLYSNRVNPQKPTILDGTEILKDYEYKYLRKEVAKGRSEYILFNKLVQRFGIENIQLGNCSLFGFYPDIAYLDLKKNILIDIEVDEIYSLKTGEPIHHLNIIDLGNGKRRTEDSNMDRDEVFRKNGWTVVRFSEEQVVSFPDHCADVIGNVVCYWEVKNSGYNFNESKLTLQPRWTAGVAREMAKRGSRS